MHVLQQGALGPNIRTIRKAPERVPQHPRHQRRSQNTHNTTLPKTEEKSLGLAPFWSCFASAFGRVRPAEWDLNGWQVSDEDLKPGMVRQLEVDKRLTVPTRTHIRPLALPPGAPLLFGVGLGLVDFASSITLECGTKNLKVHLV